MAKRIIKYCVFIILVGALAYLSFSLISSDESQKNAEHAYCATKCNYNSDSLFWEFSGGYSTKGFTTKEECLSYCSKSWEGLVYEMMNSSYASLQSAFQQGK